MGIKFPASLWLVLAMLPAWAGSATTVAVISAQAADSGRSLVVDAILEPLHQSTMTAQLSGNLLALLVKAGDRVSSGQALARIDARDADASLQRAEAALVQSRAEASNAQAHLARTRDLKAKGFVSSAALDMAETQARAATAGVQQAQAGRAQAALARDFASVRAPFDGVVLATHLQAGDLATPGRAIVTLYAPGALRAVAQVGVSRAELARQAGRVELELADGRRIVPLRRTELAAADPVSQTIEWRLDLPPAASAGLLPGQAVRAVFELGPGSTSRQAATTLRLPQAAVLRRGELSAVYVVDGERFALRAVRLGAQQADGQVEVLAGLRADERVAADALRAGLAGARPAPAQTAPR